MLMFETPSSYGFGLAAFALGISTTIIIRFIIRLAKNKVDCFEFVLLGYGVLGILDIASYELFYHHLREEIEEEYRLQALGWLFASVATFGVMYWLTPLAISLRAIGAPAPTQISEKRFWAFIAPVGILLGMLYALKLDLLQSSYVDLAGYAAKAVIILAFFLFLDTRKRRYAVFAASLFALSMVDTSRRALLVVLMPLLVMYVDAETLRRHQNAVQRMVKISLAVAGIFVFSMFMRSAHDFGDDYVEGNRIANTVNYISNLRVADTFYNTAFVIKNFPRPYPYYLGETYAAVPVGLIPRAWWPDKPVGLGALLGLMQTTGSSSFDYDAWLDVNQFSLAPGFVGEAYANFGAIGVLVLSGLLGIASRIIDVRSFHLGGWGRRITPSVIPVLPFLPGLMISIRGDFYAAMLYPIFVSGFLYLFIRMVKGKYFASPGALATMSERRAE